MKKIIIITGCLASGKSSFYNELTRKIRIDSFSKDDVKIDIYSEASDYQTYNNYELGNLAFNRMLCEAEKLMIDGRDLIIEGAFCNEDTENKENEQNRIMLLIKKYKYNSLVFHFTGEMQKLHERFLKREYGGERNQVLRFKDAFTNYRIYKLINKKLLKCSFEDNVIEIDTTDFAKVEFLNYYDIAVQFMES